MRNFRPLHRIPRLAQTFALMLVLTSGWAHAQGQEVRIEAYGNAFSEPSAAPRTQTRVYAYRSPEVSNPAPINLYLNGRYHASLLKGGYTEFCLNPGRVMVQSALDDAGQQHVGKTVTGQPIEAQGARLLYLRVTEGNGRTAQIQTINEPQALPDIRRTRRQLHTLSRAPDAQACNTDLATTPEAAPKAAPPKRDFTLAADALFEFGKAQLKPEGVQAILTLVQQVKQEYTSINTVQVLGYTDAIGSVDLNRNLSAQRARNVALLLNQNGLQPTQGYTMEGRGSAELAKRGCGNKPTPENKACHAPNRRVVISLTGTRK